MSNPLVTSVEATMKFVERTVPSTHPPVVDRVPANSIIVRSGNLTSAPEVVSPDAAVKSLRELSAEEQQIVGRRLAEDADRAEQLARAIEVQDQWKALQAEHKKLSHELSWIDGCKIEYETRIREIEAQRDSSYGYDVKLNDLRVEHANRSFTLAGLPAGRKRRADRLALLETEMAAFSKKHDVANT
jgi:hypothetical protein